MAYVYDYEEEDDDRDDEADTADTPVPQLWLAVGPAGRRTRGVPALQEPVLEQAEEGEEVMRYRLAVLGFVAAIASCGSARAADPRLEYAHLKAHEYAYTFLFQYPITVRIVEQARLPRHNAMGTVGRGEGGVGCRISLSDDGMRSVGTIAHEVCHCVLDYDLLAQDAYRSTVSAFDAARMETRARICERWLISNDPNDVLERRMVRRTGMKPAFLRD